MVNYLCILNKIDVSEFALPLSLHHDGEHLLVNMTVLDRTEKKSVDLKFVYATWRTKCEKKALEYVYDCIKDAVLHELREQFYFQGERIYDPHVGDSAPLTL